MCRRKLTQKRLCNFQKICINIAWIIILCRHSFAPSQRCRTDCLSMRCKFIYMQIFLTKVSWMDLRPQQENEWHQSVERENTFGVMQRKNLNKKTKLRCRIWYQIIFLRDSKTDKYFNSWEIARDKRKLSIDISAFIQWNNFMLVDWSWDAHTTETCENLQVNDFIQ